MTNTFQQINIEQLDSVSFGDKEFKKELIEIFLKQIPEFISNMNKFFAEGDLTNLAKEAHTAKSSALIFDMKNTGESLKKIQLLSEDETVEPLSHLIKKVNIELNEAAKQLQVILSEL
jgi:HPt (histidine-containing phosphotransfer) domain-containing protein